MTPALEAMLRAVVRVLAPLVGAFADSMPKGQVMLITNGVKVVGCVLMLFTLHPLAAYAVVGFGAAAYSPAKYGILTELLPPQQLVVANGWIEGTTVASIILGVLTGGALIGPRSPPRCSNFDMPYVDTGIETPPEAAISVIMLFYVIAAIFNCFIPNTGVDHRIVNRNPLYLIREFAHCVVAALARQARPGFARDDDAVLGRRRDAAIHRDRLGGAAAPSRPLAGIDAAGRRRRGHRARRGDRRAHVSLRGASRCCRSAC
jgi:MFS family permease